MQCGGGESTKVHQGTKVTEFNASMRLSGEGIGSFANGCWYAANTLAAPRCGRSQGILLDAGSGLASLSLDVVLPVPDQAAEHLQVFWNRRISRQNIERMGLTQEPSPVLE